MVGFLYIYRHIGFVNHKIFVSVSALKILYRSGSTIDVNVCVDGLDNNVRNKTNLALRLSSSVIFLVVGYGSSGLIPRLNSAAAEKVVPQKGYYSCNARLVLFLRLFYQHRHLHL